MYNIVLSVNAVRLLCLLCSICTVIVSRTTLQHNHIEQCAYSSSKCRRYCSALLHVFLCVTSRCMSSYCPSSITHSYILNTVYAYTHSPYTNRKHADTTATTASATESQEQNSDPTVAKGRSRGVFSSTNGGASTRVYRSRAAKMMDGYANRYKLNLQTEPKTKPKTEPTLFY
jgi:hypothetical protein